MQLLQDCFQLFGDRQSQVRGVFQQAHAFVGKVEEDHCRPKNASLANDVDVQNVGNTDQGEDQHLAADALETHRAGKVMVSNRAHHAGNVVNDHKGDEGIQESVRTAEKPAEKAAQGSERDLNAIPNLFHILFLLYSSVN